MSDEVMMMMKPIRAVDYYFFFAKFHLILRKVKIKRGADT